MRESRYEMAKAIEERFDTYIAKYKLDNPRIYKRTVDKNGDPIRRNYLNYTSDKAELRSLWSECQERIVYTTPSSTDYYNGRWYSNPIIVDRNLYYIYDFEQDKLVGYANGLGDPISPTIINQCVNEAYADPDIYINGVTSIMKHLICVEFV